MNDSMLIVVDILYPQLNFMPPVFCARVGDLKSMLVWYVFCRLFGNTSIRTSQQESMNFSTDTSVTCTGEGQNANNTR